MHSRRIRRMAAALAASLCLLALPAVAQQGGRPPQPVTVMTIHSGPVALTDVLPGRAVAFRKAEVRPQVDGLIQHRLFDEGARVEAGQQLYQIDPETYRATLNEARADVAKAKATYALNLKKLRRYESLLQTQAASQQAYDDAKAAADEARAAVAAAQARVETAAIDLERTTLTAPISGVIGRSDVTEGALVTANQGTPLATITVLDPIHVDLTQSSTRLLNMRHKIATGTVEATADAPVTLLLNARGDRYAHPGTLQFTEVLVDSSTSSVTLRAVFPNPDQVLLPGMFVRAEVSQGRIADGVLIPQKAVQRTPNGSPFVWIADEADAVARRSVVIERAVDDDWLVTGGVVDGDRVVLEGFQKIAQGAKVVPQPVDQAPDSAAPAAAPQN